jgi:hypothetical protein
MWYACCWGTVVRWGKGHSAVEAAKYAFGLYDANRMTIEKFPTNPRYTSQKKIKEFQSKLFVKHKERTGREIV